MQTSSRLLIVSGLVPLALSVLGDDGTNRVYVTGDIGPAFVHSVNTTPGGAAIDFNAGLRSDVGVGYRFTPWLATELATGLIFNSVDSIGGVTMHSYGGHMDLYQIPLMGNVVLTAPGLGRWQPYMGGGLGCVLGHLDFGSPLGDINDTDYTFSYQALVGLNYQVSKHVLLGVGYKYLCTGDHNWSQNGVTLDTEGTASHSVTFSLTWNF